MKKAVANLFENLFFSFNVSKAMFKKCLSMNLILLVGIILLSVYGISRNQFAIPILQLFLSRYFLLDIIKTYRFRNDIEEAFDDLKDISNHFCKGRKLSYNELKFIKILLGYEVLIAETNISLDTKVFNQMNQQLTAEWNTLKKKYMMEEYE